MSRTSRTWITAAGATALCAVSGSLATDPDSAWYRSLDKPTWQPPAIAFPVVWTALYAGLAVTGARTITALDRTGQTDEAHGFRRAFWTNLALNQGWSWTFFRAHSLGLATLNAGALAASSIDLARRAGAVSPARRAELVPYATWCTFATVLSAAITRRNR